MSQPVTLQQAAVFLCGAQDVFILTHKAPDGDTLGSALTIRKDDAPETVKSRLEVYHRETEPLKAFYEARGKLKSVDNQPSIEATTAEIEKALGI